MSRGRNDVVDFKILAFVMSGITTLTAVMSGNTVVTFKTRLSDFTLLFCHAPLFLTFQPHTYSVWEAARINLCTLIRFCRPPLTFSYAQLPACVVLDPSMAPDLVS